MALLKRIALFVFPVLLTAEISSAYIPPSEFLLKTWASRHDGVKAVKVKTLVTGFKEGLPSSVRFKETSYFDAQTGILLSVATDEAGRKIYSSAKDKGSVSPIAKLLFYRDFRDVGRTLKANGVPIQLEEDLLKLDTEEERIQSEVLSLGRWNGLTAWIVGNDSQIWFQKDAFVPVRVFLKSSEGPIEVRMEQVTGNFPYPRLFTVGKKTGETLFQSRVEEFSAIEESAIPKGGSTEVSSEDPSLKALTQLYYDLVR